MSIESGDSPKMNDQYRFSRIMYMIEAALEYFISIAVGTVYLAKITAYIGMSDSLTGILSAFVSLGCGFQLLAVFLVNRRPVKKWVTSGHIISQILFSCTYFVPLLDLGRTQRAVLFVAVMLLAQIIHNVINSAKINWFMSLVDNNSRGKFTANKEMVSLISGMAFSYGLGAVMDYFEEKGDIRTAFAVCGIGLFVLCILHSMTLILSREKPVEVKPTPLKESIKELIRNRTLLKIILVPVLWNIANYATTSFSGTYQTKELAFTTTFSSIVIMSGSILRAAASKPIGSFADKYSFRKMLIFCFSAEVLAFGINIFTLPSNGKYFFFAYYLLHSVGMAGINSAVINLIYDYFGTEQRTSVLAIQQTCAGLSGFFAVLLLSPVVSFIQRSKPMIFGERIFAQQILSLFSCLLTGLIILYLSTVIRNLDKTRETNKETDP